jgi:hypothetical protein
MLLVNNTHAYTPAAAALIYMPSFGARRASMRETAIIVRV